MNSQIPTFRLDTKTFEKSNHIRLLLDLTPSELSRWLFEEGLKRLELYIKEVGEDIIGTDMIENHFHPFHFKDGKRRNKDKNRRGRMKIRSI